MTFLNPAILFGLLAAGLPVMIHLLTKPRLKRIKWAASRFLLLSIQKNRRSSQIEDILLLVLRCLLIALLVLIFARPAFLTNAIGPQTSSGASTAVIVLDNSESMGQSDGVRTRFDQAKSMIDAIFSKLKPGSSSALYLVSTHAKALIPKPTKDFALLRRFLAQATLTDGGSDLYPGVKAAVDLLKAVSGRREIFVLTDSQVAAWRELPQIRQLQEENKGIEMHFLVVGEKGEDNVAVSGLQVVGTAAVVNQPLRCAIKVSNWGKVGVENIPVKLAADDEQPQDETMIDRIEPGKSKVVTLFARFREPGYHSVTATISGDRLPADNQRSTAFLVFEQIHALVVEGTTNPDPTARDGFFLSHALVPVRPDQVDSYYMKVTVGPPSQLDSSAINQYEIIFLSNLAQLTPVSAPNLRQYVNQGGTLVVFPGPTTDPNFYNNDPNLSALLPAQLGPAQDAPAAQKFLSWQSKDYTHPVTTLWNDPASGNLGSVRVTKYFPLTLKTSSDATAPSAQTVVKYADGQPAVVEQAVGKGKVFLFSSTATTTWSTLPIHPAFVPLLMRIVAYATGGQEEKLNIVAGQPFVFEVDSEYTDKDLSVLRPGEKKRRSAGKVERGDHASEIRYADTDLAGPYQIFLGDETKPKVAFAVQGDPEESNLAQEPAAEIDSLVNPTPPTAQTETASAQKAEAGPRIPGQEIWLPLVLATLLLAMVELMLAHRMSQSK